LDNSKRLGIYEIQGLIGRGGMGEVYAARLEKQLTPQINVVLNWFEELQKRVPLR